MSVGPRSVDTITDHMGVAVECVATGAATEQVITLT